VINHPQIAAYSLRYAARRPVETVDKTRLPHLSRGLEKDHKLFSGNQEWAYAGRGETPMTHSNLRVEVLGNTIVVAMRGTCFRAKYRKQEAPWLATDEFGPDDPDAAVTFSEFRNLAYSAANDRARQLGWVRSCDDLHKSTKREPLRVQTPRATIEQNK
jgi:hypothetical protein